MRLLFVGTSKTGGGTETHFITLAKALTDVGHEVAAVVRPGCPIELGLKNTKVRLFEGTFRNSLDFRGVRAVNQAIKEFTPDWIVGSFSKEYWPLIYVSRRHKIPLVLFRHMATRMKRGTQYFVPRLANRFVVISNFMKELFVERGIPSDLIRVLHNPLDLEYFKPDPELRINTRNKLNLSESDFLVGFVGALHPGKGIYVLHQVMEDAMKKNSHIYMMWIGEGVDEKKFKETIQASNFALRNFIQGYSVDVRPWYAAMDLLAVPSIEYDTFGRVSIEAQACGIPVFGSRYGGIVETLEEGTSGKLLPPGDVRLWSKSILECASKGNLNEEPGAREFVATKFAPDRIAEQFVEMLGSESKVN